MDKYLPSKQFIKRVGIIAIVILVSFVIYKIVVSLKTKIANQPAKLVLVKDVIQNDTNENDIPDWEESLWGLDPNTDGEKNKEIITAKRAELAKSNDEYIIEGNTPSKATEDLSKEFFSVIISLQQTGNLDQDALDAVGKAVGEKITAGPIPDVYTNSNITIKTTTSKTVAAYYAGFKKLTEKYASQDIGNELIFISQGIKNNDPQAVAVVSSIAEAYHLFGQDLLKIPVPDSISPYHLSLANNYEKVSLSIIDLLQILSEPITGMKGLINYKKYNDALVSDIESISDNLE